MIRCAGEYNDDIDIMRHERLNNVINEVQLFCAKLGVMWSLSFVQCIVQVPVYFYITGYDNSGKLPPDRISSYH